MKSFLKIFILMTVALAAGFFTACSDSDPEPESVSGEQVYFPESITTDYSISDDVTSISIPVRRIATEAAFSMAVLAEDESGLFTIPSSVSFAAGQAESELRITFDRKSLEDGTSYPLAFLLNDENNTTPYGNRTLAITVTPWPWEEMGTGKFRDGYLGDIFTGAKVEIEVTIHKHKSKDGVYMVEEMFGWPYMTEFFEASQADLSGQFSYTPSNIVFDCTDPQNVTVAKQWTGITENSNGYGEFMFASQAPGTLVNGIITFPKKGLTAQLVGLDRNFDVNADGTFRIMFPGAEEVDYSLAAAYGGMKVSPESETSAVIDFSYGDDVSGISFVLASGDVTAKADEIAEQIAKGTAENILEVEGFTAGSKAISVEAALDVTGVYTVVALPKDKAGERVASEVAAVSFYFPGMGGSEAPDCDATVEVMPVSEFNPSLVEEYPEHKSLACSMQGTDLVSMRYYFNTTELIDAVQAGEVDGLTLQDVMDQYGRDLSASQMESYKKNGYYGTIFLNLDPATPYTCVLEAKNMYGKSALVVSNSASTAQVPYSGELVIGKYTMTYVANAQTTFTNVFDVIPTADSETAFYVKNIGIDDGSSWNAVYDPQALTLTLDGTLVGEEQDGNLFGGIFGYWDSAKTQVYGFYSFATDDSKGDDPLVMSVDGSTKQLSKLNCQLQIPVVDADTKQTLGYGGFYPTDTPITPYTAEKSAVTAKIQRVNIPFSSVRIPAALRDTRFRTAAGVSVSLPNGFRTLNVRTAKCEPLPKTGTRSLKKSIIF